MKVLERAVVVTLALYSMSVLVSDWMFWVKVFSLTPGWVLLILALWQSFTESGCFCFCWCVFFTSMVNSYGHVGTVSQPNHTFPGQAYTF